MPRIALRCIAAALTAGLPACGGDLVPRAGARGPVAPPPAIMEGVVFEGYAGRSRQVEVRATRARVDTAERVAHLEGVRILFSDPVRGPVSIRAEAGTLDLADDDFVLHGRVEGEVAEGERFETSEVRYDASRDRLWTDQPVRVTRPNLRLEGDGLEIDVQARRLTIRGHVRTTIEASG